MIVCPTVTATNIADFKKQLDVAESLSSRVHLDLMDGILTTRTSPSLSEIGQIRYKSLVDIHLMYQEVVASLDAIIKMKPNLVLIHYLDNLNLMQIFTTLKTHKIKTGLVLSSLPSDKAKINSILVQIDHVLIFGGKLGFQGGVADLSLLPIVHWLKESYPKLEIGWDGGINKANIKIFLQAGVEVFNIGSYIQASFNPQNAYVNIIQEIG